jgi:hypothetical protein
MWSLGGLEFTSEMIEDYIGYVYCITDLRNNKKYIGKKLFTSTRRLAPLKGKSRKRIVKKESDWQEYYGSSEEVKLLVEELGPSNFKREILHLCKGKGELSYMELFEQIKRNALLRDDYYNGICQAKIHRSHVKNINPDDLDFCSDQNASAPSQSRRQSSDSEGK